MLVTERLLFRRLYTHPNPVIIYLILTIGLTQILSNVIELVYTVDPRTLFTSYLYTYVNVFGIRTNAAALISIAITYAALFAVAVLISYTRFGRAFRGKVWPMLPPTRTCAGCRRSAAPQNPRCRST